MFSELDEIRATPGANLPIAEALVTTAGALPPGCRRSGSLGGRGADSKPGREPGPGWEFQERSREPTTRPVRRVGEALSEVAADLNLDDPDDVAAVMATWPGRSAT